MRELNSAGIALARRLAQFGRAATRFQATPKCLAVNAAFGLVHLGGIVGLICPPARICGRVQPKGWAMVASNLRGTSRFSCTCPCWKRSGRGEGFAHEGAQQPARKAGEILFGSGAPTTPSTLPVATSNAAKSECRADDIRVDAARPSPGSIPRSSCHCARTDDWTDRARLRLRSAGVFLGRLAVKPPRQASLQLAQA
jgi:hypothetical protein